MKIVTKELAPALWPQLETLFGENGACGGCWCQAWRVELGEKWDEIQGPTAKARLRKGIRSGTTHGILAFVGNEPVGWCNFGPRTSFPRLDRSRTLQCDDAPHVWSVPCFFVVRGFRGKGVATAMLAHAVRAMARRGVEIVEGYPVKPNKDGKYIPAFSWTGTRELFKGAGFRVVGNRDGGKQRVRKILRAAM
jgi:GNAT superfamily N-acetyltransferase